MSILHARRGLVVAAIASLVAVLSLTAAPAAQADRCQPEELIGLSQLIDEDKNPVCFVMDGVVYPALVCDGSTQANCMATLDVVATANNAPATAAATPFRALSAAAKTPDAIKRIVVGDPPDCSIGIFRPGNAVRYYYYCVLGDPVGDILAP